MAISNWNFLQIALVLTLLIAGVINDLRSKKVRNQIVIAGFLIGLVFVVSSQGVPGLLTGALSMMTAAAAVFPLYLLRVFGGGDVKLLLAASVMMSWKEVLITLFASMIWGSLLGVLQVFLKGQGKAFAHNLLAMANRAKLQEASVHKMPFTVALLFGYLTNLVWLGVL